MRVTLKMVTQYLNTLTGSDNVGRVNVHNDCLAANAVSREGHCSIRSPEYQMYKGRDIGIDDDVWSLIREFDDMGPKDSYITKQQFLNRTNYKEKLIEKGLTI